MTVMNYIQNYIQHSSLKVNAVCRRNYLGSLVWISINRSTTDQIFCIDHQLFIDFKKAYDSVRRKVLEYTTFSLNSTFH
jgi:hypothetical protein